MMHHAANAHLKVGRNETEIEELEGHPELPVCNDSGLQILLELALDLIRVSLHHICERSIHAWQPT